MYNYLNLINVKNIYKKKKKNSFLNKRKNEIGK